MQASNPSVLRVYDYVLDTILTDQASVDSPIPTEMDLASRLGVSRMSAQAAVQELERRGIVRRTRGVGTFIARKPSASMARQLKGFSARRVHVVSGLEQVPLHWTMGTLQELETLLAQEGYAVSHLDIPQTLTRESLETMLKAISGEGSTALVLILPERAAQFFQQNAELVFRYHRNVLLLDRGDTPPESWPFHVVSLDPFGEGVLAAQYLYDRGYRRMAFWPATSEQEFWVARRVAGFRMGLDRASNGKLTPLVWENSGQADAPQMARRLLELEGPVGVAVSTDEGASWLLDAAAELGLSAPRDFGVIGFDNNALFRRYNLTTIAPPLDGMAETLARLTTGKLLSLEKFSSVVLRTASHVVERSTCAMVAEAETMAVL